MHGCTLIRVRIYAGAFELKANKKYLFGRTKGPDSVFISFCYSVLDSCFLLAGRTTHHLLNS